ncbi:MAG TPA: hypothetical protein VLG50_07735 [Candidatus Saccharimonadales bacterium]|nr:hypothetical protein [Candidatus Saccharimonadales bacterium]
MSNYIKNLIYKSWLFKYYDCIDDIINTIRMLLIHVSLKRQFKWPTFDDIQYIHQTGYYENEQGIVFQLQSIRRCDNNMQSLCSYADNTNKMVYIYYKTYQYQLWLYIDFVTSYIHFDTLNFDKTTSFIVL